MSREDLEARLPALLAGLVEDTYDGSRQPLVAAVGQRLAADPLPTRPRAGRLKLTAAAGTYLDVLAPPDPWALAETDGGTGLVWEGPSGRLVDVPLVRRRDHRLVDDPVRERLHGVLGEPGGLVAVRVLALLAPACSLLAEPSLPVRHRPLVGTDFAFELAPADLPDLDDPTV